jgi:hypothetical protein
MIRLDPGSWTIALADLLPNCAFDGPGSRLVTVVDAEVVTIGFAVACTATSGVIEVFLEPMGSDVEGGYGVTLDGVEVAPIMPGRATHIASVPAGDHVVSLRTPGNCAVENPGQSVTVTAGEMIRDTAQVTLRVTCAARLGALQITVRTTGPVPDDSYYPTRYRVLLLVPDSYYYDYPALLGQVMPNDGLIARVEPGSYRLELDDVPANCAVQVFNPTAPFTVTHGATLNFEFPVECVP